MIQKAVITAAGNGTRLYPATNSIQKELFPLIDRDGIAKPTIQIIAEQALEAGIKEICIIVQPGEDVYFKRHFSGLSETAGNAFKDKSRGLKQAEILEQLQSMITYTFQTVQEGYGHAVYCAKDFVGSDPFLLMLGDHLFISHTETSCIDQLITTHEVYQKPVFSLKQTPADQIYLFGTAASQPIEGNAGFYQVTGLAEKPSIEFAKQNLLVKGLPDNTFMTLFGIHILTPEIFDILGEHIKQDKREKGEIQLAAAQDELCKTVGVIGREIDGERLDMGTPLGFLQTQAALAMNSVFAREFWECINQLKGN